MSLCRNTINQSLRLRWIQTKRHAWNWLKINPTDCWLHSAKSNIKTSKTTNIISINTKKYWFTFLCINVQKVWAVLYDHQFSPCSYGAYSGSEWPFGGSHASAGPACAFTTFWPIFPLTQTQICHTSKRSSHLWFFVGVFLFPLLTLVSEQLCPYTMVLMVVLVLLVD